MTARTRTWSVGAGLLLLTAAAAGYGWYWWTTPTPPENDLTGAPPAVAEAIAAARRAVQESPRSAEAWGTLGMVLYANDHAAPAHDCFIQAERFDPDAPIWPYLQAVRLLPRERDKAVALLERAMTRADGQHGPDALPHLGTPHLTLAEIYIEEERHDEAQALCQRVLAFDPDHARAHLDLGMIALADGQPERCIEHLTRALASPYAARRASLQLAAAYQRLGDTASAIAFQRRAKDLPAERPWPDPYVLKAQAYNAGPSRHEQRARQLAQHGQPGEYLRALRDMAEEAGDGVSHYRLGVALAEAGDYAAAEPVLQTALRKAPHLFSARFALGVVLLRQAEKDAAATGIAGTAQDRFRRATECLRIAVDQRPTYGLAHLSLGQALQGLGRSTDAVAEFRLAVSCQPELADAQLALGEALAAAGKQTEAQQHLQQAQSLAPGDRRPPAALARLRGTGGTAGTPDKK